MTLTCKITRIPEPTLIIPTEAQPGDVLTLEHDRQGRTCQLLNYLPDRRVRVTWSDEHAPATYRLARVDG